MSTGQWAAGVHLDTSSTSVGMSGTSTTCRDTGTRARSCMDDSPSFKNHGNCLASGETVEGFGDPDGELGSCLAPEPLPTISTKIIATHEFIFIQTA